MTSTLSYDRSLVIPMYREAGRIGPTIDALCRWPGRVETEVLFVDDGSDDGTADVVEQALARDLVGRLIRLPENRGKGFVVRTGMMAATGRVVGFADADLSAGLDEIMRCFEAIDELSCDIVVATRARDDSVIAVAQPAARKLSGQFFNLAVRLLGLTTMPDTQCGLKTFRADVVASLFEPLTVDRFAFDVEVLARADRLDLKVRELPIHWEHREASRVSPLRDGTKMLRDVWRVRRALGPPPRRS